jgi:hypothetical protein
MTMTFAGGCFCGQVRYLATTQPVNVRICHCGRCRRASGGLFYGRAVFPKDALERHGETATYASSPRPEAGHAHLGVGQAGVAAAQGRAAAVPGVRAGLLRAKGYFGLRIRIRPSWATEATSVPSSA